MDEVNLTVETFNRDRGQTKKNEFPFFHCVLLQIDHCSNDNDGNDHPNHPNNNKTNINGKAVIGMGFWYLGFSP